MSMIEDLIARYPFCRQFVRHFINDVKWANVWCIPPDLLNLIPYLIDQGGVSKQWNIFFLNDAGRPLHKVVSTPFKKDGEVKEGPGKKSVGREFLSLPTVTQDQIAFILVQEWETSVFGGEEQNSIDITLFKPPSRYTVREFIEELSPQIKFLYLDQPEQSL